MIKTINHKRDNQGITKAPDRHREKDSMLTCRASNALHDKLAEVARQKGITISELIRRYVTSGLLEDYKSPQRITVRPLK